MDSRSRNAPPARPFAPHDKAGSFRVGLPPPGRTAPSPGGAASAIGTADGKHPAPPGSPRQPDAPLPRAALAGPGAAARHGPPGEAEEGDAAMKKVSATKQHPHAGAIRRLAETMDDSP